jgi:hypothetical protein
MNPRLLRLGMPITQRVITAFQTAAAPACFLHIPTSSRAARKEDRGGDWQHPVQPRVLERLDCSS